MANDACGCDSKERVAFDLMRQIDHVVPAANRETKEYWLKLYLQCRAAVLGCDMDLIREYEKR